MFTITNALNMTYLFVFFVFFIYFCSFVFKTTINITEIMLFLTTKMTVTDAPSNGCIIFFLWGRAVVCMCVRRAISLKNSVYAPASSVPKIEEDGTRFCALMLCLHHKHACCLFLRHPYTLIFWWLALSNDSAL